LVLHDDHSYYEDEGKDYAYDEFEGCYESENSDDTEEPLKDFDDSEY
jgi:hypothetical protein